MLLDGLQLRRVSCVDIYDVRAAITTVAPWASSTTVSIGASPSLGASPSIGASPSGGSDAVQLRDR